MIDPKKLTGKSSQAIQAAASQAQEMRHSQFSPVHLAVALFEDPAGDESDMGAIKLMLRAKSA